MYTPRKFKQEELGELLGLMRDFPFATLIANTSSGLEINHLPLLIEEREESLFLKGHIAKANGLWRQLEEASEVKVVFNGPHCYVSPNHYPSKHFDHKVVPTWNYAVVHVTGELVFKHEANWLLSLLDELTNVHEKNSEIPWSVADAPHEYIQKMLGAIVGIEVKVTHLEGKWKLSQNQSQQNKQGVIEGLAGLDEALPKAVSKMASSTQS